MNVLKMRKKTNCLLFSIIILFTFSCNNTITEDNDASNNELTNVNSNESLTSQLRQIHSAPSTSARTSMFDSQKSNDECFEFIYPISFVLPDGSEITINSDEDWDKIDLWYEENKDSEEEPEIVYPFDVIVEDEIITVESEDGLDRLKEVCD